MKNKRKKWDFKPMPIKEVLKSVKKNCVICGGLFNDTSGTKLIKRYREQGNFCRHCTAISTRVVEHRITQEQGDKELLERKTENLKKLEVAYKLVEPTEDDMILSNMIDTIIKKDKVVKNYAYYVKESEKRHKKLLKTC